MNYHFKTETRSDQILAELQDDGYFVSDCVVDVDRQVALYEFQHSNSRRRLNLLVNYLIGYIQLSDEKRILTAELVK